MGNPVRMRLLHHYPLALSMRSAVDNARADNDFATTGLRAALHCQMEWADLERRKLPAGMPLPCSAIPGYRRR